MAIHHKLFSFHGSLMKNLAKNHLGFGGRDWFQVLDFNFWQKRNSFVFNTPWLVIMEKTCYQLSYTPKIFP